MKKRCRAEHASKPRECSVGSKPAVGERAQCHLVLEMWQQSSPLPVCRVRIPAKPPVRIAGRINDLLEKMAIFSKELMRD